MSNRIDNGNNESIELTFYAKETRLRTEFFKFIASAYIQMEVQ